MWWTAKSHKQKQTTKYQRCYFDLCLTNQIFRSYSRSDQVPKVNFGAEVNTSWTSSLPSHHHINQVVPHYKKDTF